MKRDICPLYNRLIYTMYLNSNAIVEWNNCRTLSFKLTNGVKQGGILSLQLFALYLDPLLYEVQNSDHGCYMVSHPCNIFAYADDMVLLAPTVKAVKELLHLCKKYSQNFEINFNSVKT